MSDIETRGPGGFVTPKVIIMTDIESLALGTRPVITQVAMISVSIDDPDSIVREIWNHFPVQPQLELMPSRDISASTIAWWLRRSDDARRKMAESIEGDYEDLAALVRHTAREFGFMIEGLKRGEYEVWARGPQFDIAALETLFKECGVDVPWDYESVRDLRTLMAMAAITKGDVTMEGDLIPHQARSDALFQIRCYVEANRLLRHR